MRLARLTVLAILALVLLAPPLGAEGQPAGTLPRVGILTLGSPSTSVMVAPLLDELRRLGYIEGQTITFDIRYADGRLDRVRGLATELVGARVDMIVTTGTTVVQEVRAVAGNTPIVVANMGNPIGAGFAASFARPGGNVTGLAHQSSDLHTKRLQLLKEVIPGLSRVVFLYDEHLRRAIGDVNSVKAAETAAGAMALTAFPSAVEHEADFGSAFERAKRVRAQAVLLFGSPTFTGYRQTLVDRAIKARLPMACEEREFVVVGCLVAYGPRYSDMFRRAATYVDRIVKGAKPADLPIEQPTKFELVINLKTAKTLGLTIPPAVLARADEVIQ